MQKTLADIVDPCPVGGGDRCKACRHWCETEIIRNLEYTRKNQASLVPGFAWCGCKKCGHMMVIDSLRLRDLNPKEASQVRDHSKFDAFCKLRETFIANLIG